jgi:hypothetical protein
MTPTLARKSAIAQRLKPAGAAAVGVLILGFNVVMLIATERFFPVGTILGCVLVFTGGFGVVVGEPEDVYGYRPMWFKAGLVACAVVGALVAILLNIELASE